MWGLPALDEMDLVAFASFRERLARLLLELRERYGDRCGEGCRITLRLKREELAEMAAMTVETSVRMLTAFQASGLIRTKGREITLIDVDRLASVAKESPIPRSRL